MQGVPVRDENIPHAPPPVPYQPAFPDFQQHQFTPITDIPQQSHTFNYANSAQLNQPNEHAPVTENIPTTTTIPIFNGNLVAFNNDFLNTQQQQQFSQSPQIDIHAPQAIQSNNFNTGALQQNGNYVQGYGNAASFNNDVNYTPQLNANNQQQYGSSNSLNIISQPSSIPNYVQQDTAINYANQFSQQNVPYTPANPLQTPFFQGQQDNNVVTGERIY
jgi:hypothetical protein